MLKANTLQISDVTVMRLGVALLVIGLVSLAQAAGLFPLGSSTYPDALALIVFGSAISLIELGRNNKSIEFLQGVLMLCGMALVIIF